MLIVVVVVVVKAEVLSLSQENAISIHNDVDNGNFIFPKLISVNGSKGKPGYPSRNCVLVSFVVPKDTERYNLGDNGKNKRSLLLVMVNKRSHGDVFLATVGEFSVSLSDSIHARLTPLDVFKI